MVLVLKVNAYSAYVDELAKSAYPTVVLVLKVNAYSAYVDELAVNAFTAAVTNVLVLKFKAYPLVVANKLADDVDTLVNTFSPAMYISPPTHKSRPIPTPPETCKAPELVFVAELMFDVRIISSVSTSVVVTVVYSMVNFWATISPPTYRLPPMPTPPATRKAPLSVVVADVLLMITYVPVPNANPIPAISAYVLDDACVALLTNVLVLKFKAYPLVVANELVSAKNAFTAVATNVLVLKFNA